ncbi:MAG: tRNA preQ1(34) S-adenosylmethionine ribosyltransferase-isomerase QueA [Lachnospiraceae bacterium]|nr:tRNA preQ1(34) S-adenosylmethionine ribosyltransferase-isomerase QueA [Lachnospiraceae bacterium]
MLKTSDFYYDLPKELIAQDPLADRSSSRLLVMNKETGELTHTVFSEVVKYLEPGDCLVINDTKVIPARLLGERLPREVAGGRNEKAQAAQPRAHMELLLLKRLGDRTWETLAKPGKRAQVGDRISFGEGMLLATVTEVKDDGNRIVRFDFDGIFEEILDKLGQMPLPPYITHKLQDKNRYQTVYAKYEGSAAAPTAGLHFTKELLAEIAAKGVSIAHVTLHVGLGTFRPVKEENVLDHKMHTETYRILQKDADLINEAHRTGHRVICVGTTSCRTIETVAAEDGTVAACEGDTSIFIYPGYRFKCMDGLITNFHLPESTLIMLVSAFAGKERVMHAYEEAVKERYRFFSFGDACLFL